MMDPDCTGRTETRSEKAGLTFIMAAFCLIAHVGAGQLLALPKAIANTGWSGIFLLVILGGSGWFSVTLLGKSWMILEERWPERYNKPVRQPYAEIIHRACGTIRRKYACLCLLYSLFGLSIGLLLHSAEAMNSLAPGFSRCQWVGLFGLCLVPFTWLGTPKAIWHILLLAVLISFMVFGIIIFGTIKESGLDYADPVYTAPTSTSFSLGFGYLFFLYGGAAIFPTIQNDMKICSHFNKAVIIALIIVEILHLSIATICYSLISNNVEANVLLTLKQSSYVVLARSLHVPSLLSISLMTLNPIFQSLEDLIRAPTEFCWQRIFVRFNTMILIILIGVAVPNFEEVFNIFGSWSIASVSFIMPSLAYIKLVDDKSNPLWPQKQISRWERAFIYANVAIGLIGGILTTASRL